MRKIKNKKETDESNFTILKYFLIMNMNTSVLLNLIYKI